jgi:hypothetical protein
MMSDISSGGSSPDSRCSASLGEIIKPAPLTKLPANSSTISSMTGMGMTPRSPTERVISRSSS